MLTREKTFTVACVLMIVFVGFAFAGLPVCALAQDGGVSATVGSSTSSTQSMSSHGGFSATTSGTPSVAGSLSASSSNGTAEAGMIAVSQQGNSNGITAMTEYSEYVKASGNINNFDVGFQYQSQAPTAQSPEPWYDVLSSPPTFGGSGLWQPSSTGSGPSTSAPWHSHW
jgi:hypothetical protein